MSGWVDGVSGWVGGRCMRGEMGGEWVGGRIPPGGGMYGVME